MAGTLVKRVLVQVTADDMDAEEKLEAISLKADELAEKHPELKVRIDTAAASAKVAVLRQELRDMSAEADAEAAKGGILSRFLGGGRGGFFGLLSKIPWLGNAVPEGAAGEGGEGTAGLLGSGTGGLAAIAAIVDALAAASTEITGVVSGFAAAGAGAGAFYLLAHPAISNLEADVTGLSSANQALGIAQQKYLIDPTKANATALKNAQDTYQATYKQMGQDAGGAAAGVVKLHNEYTKLSTAFQPEAFKVMNGVLQVANELLPHVTPFATTFADAFSGLLAKAGQFAGSPGFTDWLAQFQKLEGPSITAIGTGVGHLVTSFGKLLTVMSAKDVVNALNIAFSVLDGTIIGFTRFVQASMFVWDQFTSQWDQGVRQIKQGSHDVASGFDAARHGAASFGHGTADAFDVARHAAATGGHDVAAGFDTARHGAASAGDGIKAETDKVASFVRTHWKEIAGWIVSPVGMAVFEIRTHTHQIAQEFDQLRHDAASILAGMRHDTAADFDGTRHDIATALDGARHDIAHWTDDTVSFFAALPGRTVRALEHWADDLFHSGDNSVKSMGRGAAAGGTGVLSWFEGLPGRIVHALDRLAGDLFSAGQNALIGLVHGIEAGAAAIPSVMSGLAHEVENYFTDPLKIFSPSRVMYQHGLMVPEGVALGIEAGSPRIRQAAAGMARAVSGTALGGRGTAAGTAAGGSHITIQITGDAALRQWLKKSIRVTGGNVQVVGA